MSAGIRRKTNGEKKLIADRIEKEQMLKRKYEIEQNRITGKI